MREGIGSVFIYNIIIVFILVVFAFLGGTMSYAKAFKVNTLIADSIEKYEGFNTPAKSEIETNLATVGYQGVDKPTCPNRDGIAAMSSGSGRYRYCVYQYDEGTNYNSYGVVTYIIIDIPIISDTIAVPIYSKTDVIYNFN